MKNIGKTIRIIREIVGIRQAELALRINVSPNYISLIENQKREPSLKFLKKIAEELNVPIAAFFWEDVDYNGMQNRQQKDIVEDINRLYWDFIRNLTKSNSGQT